jgi:hypothetical protein
MAAGVLLLVGALYGTRVVLHGLPIVGLVQGLTPALRGQAVAAVDPHSARLAFIDHHAAGLILAAVLVSLGTAGMLPVLVFLYQAARVRLANALAEAGEGARGPRVPRAALVLAVFGAGAGCVSLLATQIVDVINAHDFVGQASRTHAAVENATRPTLYVVLSSFAQASQLALAFAFVIIPLNAMRAGLLSRFMGILGIASGASFIVYVLFPPLQVLQAFWLVAFGAMLTGRLQAPLPPAWETGESTPWPTQQQVRERRGGQAAAEPAGAAATPVAPVPRTPGPNASKKRKKRR